MMTIFSCLYGPYETGYKNEVSGVFRTDIGDKELFFNSFDEFYSFMKALPKEMHKTASMEYENYITELPN